jgi:hypothetical protein
MRREGSHRGVQHMMLDYHWLWSETNQCSFLPEAIDSHPTLMHRRSALCRRSRALWPGSWL